MYDSFPVLRNNLPGERETNIATRELGTRIKAVDSEIEVINTAMDMEDKSYNFYQALTAGERGHYLVLLDSYEYFTDPTGWFVRTEHPTLDGE